MEYGGSGLGRCSLGQCSDVAVAACFGYLGTSWKGQLEVTDSGKTIRWVLSDVADWPQPDMTIFIIIQCTT